MKALTIKQPWASLILSGIPVMKMVPVEGNPNATRPENTGMKFIKDIENRKWPIRESFALPQRIYVHIAKKDDDFDSSFRWICNMTGGAFGYVLLHYSGNIPRGCIVGEVTIIECVTESKSPWFVGPYGFVLVDPETYKEPIPCRGALGFFEPVLT